MVTSASEQAEMMAKKNADGKKLVLTRRASLDLKESP